MAKPGAAGNRAVRKSDQAEAVTEADRAPADDRAGVTIHPNPAPACIQLDARNFSEGRLDITIFDVVGGEVARRSSETTGETDVQIVVETQLFAPGLYLVRVVGADGGYVTSRFIKSR